ncbi:hypothetical protein EDB86DRAFT_2975657 [Lactarius hatsudake]|nr:hypothetical protein EDB86DRAFT_2975657 [Lactarius hatsudake]
MSRLSASSRSLCMKASHSSLSSRVTFDICVLSIGSFGRRTGSSVRRGSVSPLSTFGLSLRRSFSTWRSISHRSALVSGALSVSVSVEGTSRNSSRFSSVSTLISAMGSPSPSLSGVGCLSSGRPQSATLPGSSHASICPWFTMSTHACAGWTGSIRTSSSSFSSSVHRPSIRYREMASYFSSSVRASSKRLACSAAYAGSVVHWGCFCSDVGSSTVRLSSLPWSFVSVLFSL